MPVSNRCHSERDDGLCRKRSPPARDGHDAHANQRCHGRSGEPIKIGELLPKQIVFTPNGKTAYVLDGLSHDVTAVNVATRTVEATLRLGNSSLQGGEMVLTPGG